MKLDKHLAQAILWTLLLALLLAAAVLGTPAHARPYKCPDGVTTCSQGQVQETLDPNGDVTPLLTGPVLGRTAITVGGATVPAGRALHLECTATGTFTPTFADASTGTYTINATGPWTYAWAVTAVTAQTATCTYENWK